MPELTGAQAVTYVGGRLSLDEASRLLAIAREEACSYCRWHVMPVLQTSFTLDGPGAEVLLLPTGKLVSLDEIYEDGTQLDPATALRISGNGGQRIKKRNGFWWTREYGAITGKMTHGNLTAPGFDQAVLSLLDRISWQPEGGRARVIGPIQYDSEGEATPFTAFERGLLDKYRIERSAA
jgi:hypothetical protein